MLAGQCNVPLSARTLAVNIAVTEPASAGYLVIFPARTTPPLVSSINFAVGRTRANGATVALAAEGDLSISCTMPSGAVHVVLDVSGYYE